MNLLIATEPDDHHAILVKLALEKAGHLVHLLFTADHPSKQRNTIFIDNRRYHWHCADAYDTTSGDLYEVVWWRRAKKPYIPKNLAHPDDYPIILRENASFHESLSRTMAAKAWWVNDREAVQRANSKLLQLKIAAACGLNIPPTVCTNDPNSIREFLMQNPDNVIYKPLTLHLWQDEAQIKIAYTSKINSHELPNDTLLQLVPGLYQREIKKRYELRVTCFGNTLVAAKLDSQSHVLGNIDWRRIPSEDLSVTPYTLPNDISAKIRAFMAKMGLVFGALDFIVTPEGEYFFLEVNEQGQFLWIEDSNPNIKMLDMFVNFLINRSIHFEWDEQQVQHHMLQYTAEVEAIVAGQMERHVHLNQVKLFNL